MPLYLIPEINFQSENKLELQSPRAEHDEYDEEEAHLVGPNKQLLGINARSVTPPPSPADFLLANDTTNLLVGSQAEAERMDLTQQLLDEERYQEDQLRSGDGVTFGNLLSDGNYGTKLRLKKTHTINGVIYFILCLSQ